MPRRSAPICSHCVRRGISYCASWQPGDLGALIAFGTEGGSVTNKDQKFDPPLDAGLRGAVDQPVSVVADLE